MRQDHAFDTLVRRNLRKLLRYFDRLIESTEIIDEATLLRLVSSPDTTLAHRINVLRVFVTTLRNFRYEVTVVSRLDPIFELRALVVRKLLRLAKHPRVLAAQDVLVRDTEPIVEPTQHRLAGDHANRTRDRRWLRDDLRRARRDDHGF